ncbi:hypothetical protein FRB94_007935 [Tulasnella sp. JGI-2019a]|nr:hypothetical protein FRB94_007935 [Tulasnella sp. JGI-2019a]
MGSSISLRFASLNAVLRWIELLVRGRSGACPNSPVGIARNDCRRLRLLGGVSAQAAAWAQVLLHVFPTGVACQCLQEDCPTSSSLSATGTSTATTPAATLSGDLPWIRPYVRKGIYEACRWLPVRQHRATGGLVRGVPQDELHQYAQCVRVVTWGTNGVTWSDPSLVLPSPGAWLVCPDAAGNPLLYLNPGTYNLSTPTGCSDVTINYCNGAVADP